MSIRLSTTPGRPTGRYSSISAPLRLEAESYGDEDVSRFVNASFVPVEAHIKEHPAWFHRFDASWTPTVLILDSNGVERYRIEGYLPKDEFRAQLELGLARIDFKEKKWPEAEQRYRTILENYQQTAAAPEALYWSAVSHYKGTNDHTVLSQVAPQLEQISAKHLDKKSPALVRTLSGGSRTPSERSNASAGFGYESRTRLRRRR